VSEGQVAQGWYQDPYVIHEHRYFSAGLAERIQRAVFGYFDRLIKQ
jgi:hypothetical protein